LLLGLAAAVEEEVNRLPAVEVAEEEAGGRGSVLESRLDAAEEVVVEAAD
jgi:hypothetical protein